VPAGTAPENISPATAVQRYISNQSLIRDAIVEMLMGAAVDLGGRTGLAQVEWILGTGKGGEMINKITSETGAEIDIKDDGLITVASPDGESIQKALDWIKSLTEEPEVGRVYEGKVVSIKDFGAFVNIMPGTDGMVHISQLSNERVEKVTDVLSEGQMVKVKLTGIDERGRLSLSLKDAE
jgi:polyribonucleotide nucleotidyltransferase